MSNLIQPRDLQTETRLSDEFRLIPRWAIAGALLAFALTQYYFWIVLPEHRHHPSGVPVPFRLYLDHLVGCSGRSLRADDRLHQQRRSATRHERALVDGLRRHAGRSRSGALFSAAPTITATCPACGAHIEGDYHYCPQCAYQVAACCGNCYRSARITDIFCVHCGHDLTASQPPARLHAFTR